MSDHLLILLIPVLSLCGATEYYVRPTETTNTSCPAQPCLTLNQYINDSDHYFESNTVFKFLPGTHHMDRPLTIGNVHNMSLESWIDESDEYPHLVAQFPCEMEGHECIPFYFYYSDENHFIHLDFQVCCAAVWLHDVYNFTVKGISIKAQISNSAVFFLKNATNTTVQLNTTCSIYETTIGMAIYEASFVEVHSSCANNCSVGFALHYTTNTNITKVIAMHNVFVGLLLYSGIDTNINNTTAALTLKSGILISTMINTCITDMTTIYNGLEGMVLSTMDNTHITNMTTALNRGNGMSILNTNNIYITNTTSINNRYFGMALERMSNTHITDMTIALNSWGMDLSNMNNTHVINMATVHNGWDGLNLEEMNNTHITNLIATHNGAYGMFLANSSNTYMTKTTATHNGRLLVSQKIHTWHGQVLIDNSTNTLIYNTSFTGISAQSTSSTAYTISLPAVIALHQSTLHVNGCNFTGNNISAVVALVHHTVYLPHFWLNC